MKRLPDVLVLAELFSIEMSDKVKLQLLQCVSSDVAVEVPVKIQDHA